MIIIEIKINFYELEKPVFPLLFLHFSRMASAYVGVDVGTASVRAALFSEAGEVNLSIFELLSIILRLILGPWQPLCRSYWDSPTSAGFL